MRMMKSTKIFPQIVTPATALQESYWSKGPIRTPVAIQVGTPMMIQTQMPPAIRLTRPTMGAHLS